MVVEGKKILRDREAENSRENCGRSPEQKLGGTI